MCHKAMVPPQALLVVRGRSGEYRSSELRWKRYSLPRGAREEVTSQEKDCGSLRKRRRGEKDWMKSSSEWMLLRIPSQFQDKTVKEKASEELSCFSSLKKGD
jgi:hypothetical protein